MSVEDTVVLTCGSSGWVLAVSHHLSQGSRGVAEKFVIGLKRDGKNDFVKFVRLNRPIYDPYPYKTGYEILTNRA